MSVFLFKTKCPSCRKETEVKSNINGLLFINCRARIGGIKGAYCGHQVKWGPIASKAAYAAYQSGETEATIMNILTKGVNHDEKTCQSRPGTEVGAGETRNLRDPGQNSGAGSTDDGSGAGDKPEFDLTPVPVRW